jgi:hypothetical protein
MASLYKASSSLVIASISLWVATFLLYATLFVPYLDSSIKLIVQNWLPYLFLLSIAVFALGGFVEVLRKAF